MITYKVDSVKTKAGKDVQLAYLIGDTYQYKDIIKKFGGTFDTIRSRWYWWLGETQDQINNILNTKVIPCITSINGTNTSNHDTTNNKKTKVNVSEVVNAVDEMIGHVQGSGMHNEENIKKRLNQFKNELINITSSDEFRQKMEPILKFRRANDYQYSIGNTILIWIQDPKATIVKSKSKWLEYNRDILPNALKIWLWMPQIIPYSKIEKDKIIQDFIKESGVTNIKYLSAAEKKTLKDKLEKGKGMTFKLYPHWTDYRFTKQIEGKEDKLGKPNDLEWFVQGESTTKTRILFDALLQVVTDNGVSVNYANDLNGARGVSTSGTITLLSNQDKDLGMVNTLCHEYAHELLHQKFLSSKDDDYKKYFVGTKEGRHKVEQQAELCAWIVLREFGYDMPTNINYVGIWGLDKDNAAKVFDSVAAVSTFISDSISKKLYLMKTIKENQERLIEHKISGLDVAKMIGCEDVYQQSKLKDMQESRIKKIIKETIKKVIAENKNI